MAQKEFYGNGKTYDFDEAFFTSVFNQLTTNIFIKDAETDVIVYMNDAMKREFGQIHPEGKRCWEILQRGLTDKTPLCSERDKKGGFRAEWLARKEYVNRTHLQAL